MCKSPWMIWCPGAAWLDSFLASAIRCVYPTLTWSYANYLYYITCYIYNGITLGSFHFVICVIWKKSYQLYCMINQELVAIEPSTPPSIGEGGNIVSATLSCKTQTIIGHKRRLFVVARQFLATGGFQFLKVSFLQRYKMKPIRTE